MMKHYPIEILNKFIFCSVTVRSMGQDFKGFILQARKIGSSEWSNDLPVGSFDTPSSDDIKVRACSYYKDTATHSNGDPKGSRTLVWNAPFESAGNIEFRFAPKSITHPLMFRKS